MCQEKKSTFPDFRSMSYLMATAAGILTGYCDISLLNSLATMTSEIFISLLKLVSLPIIFLSVVSTASGMESLEEIKVIGKKVVKYTLSTTVVAATIALLLFLVINPVRSVTHADPVSVEEPGTSYITHLLNVIPSNVVQPFSENNVVGVLILAMILSFAIMALPDKNRTVLHTFFSSLYAAVMKITTTVVKFMPLAIWAFVTLFFLNLKGGMEFQSLALYLAVVVLANLVQAMVVLPVLLRWKGIAPFSAFKKMSPALSVAFFSKSSSAALPMAMSCAQDKAGVSSKVANFTLPLCTTINMNACAAFILTTVLFVSMSSGVVYSPMELILWVFIATAAAVGNAGVPMGCYFLSSAILVTMNVPLNILGVILPFYTLIDMLESAINVWSDSCVTIVVDKEMKDLQESEEAVPVNA